MNSCLSISFIIFSLRIYIVIVLISINIYYDFVKGLYRQSEGVMNRKFFKSGNGWALFISKTILELLKVNPETDFIEMQIENDVLKIKKINREQENKSIIKE